MTIDSTLVVRSQLLVRRPPADVFEAFVNPAITTRFWFTKSSGRLEPGARVRWDWEMYGHSAPVRVTDFERDRRLRIEWGEPATHAEWEFIPRSGDATLVVISSWGFEGTPDEIVEKAIDSKGGFTSVLAGVKALLEHDVELDLVADHYPDAHVQSD